MKTIGQGVKASTKILIAFMVGQIAQLVIQGMCISMAMWDNRRIAFCIAAGTIIFVALLAGVRIAARETAIVHQERKSYADYAVPPKEEKP